MRYALALHSRLYILDSVPSQSVYSRTLKHSRLEHNREYRVESADSRVQRVRECKVQRVESVERESTESARVQRVRECRAESTQSAESHCALHTALSCARHWATRVTVRQSKELAVQRGDTEHAEFWVRAGGRYG
jgi:hypothetical protein